MNWYIDVLRRYAQFDGRARRTEYWMFTLFNALIYMAYCIFAVLVVAVLGHHGDSPMAMVVFAPIWLYALAVLVPGLAVTVRRLHDQGKSGWWILISLVPFVGGLVLLIFMCMDSEPGPNVYGPNPKGVMGFAPMMPPPPPAY
jgi:uncharacterized membrane protein YhaH (DUF805 family)